MNDFASRLARYLQHALLPYAHHSARLPAYPPALRCLARAPYALLFCLHAHALRRAPPLPGTRILSLRTTHARHARTRYAEWSVVVVVSMNDGGTVQRGITLLPNALMALITRCLPINLPITHCLPAPTSPAIRGVTRHARAPHTRCTTATFALLLQHATATTYLPTAVVDCSYSHTRSSDVAACHRGLSGGCLAPRAARCRARDEM